MRSLCLLTMVMLALPAVAEIDSPDSLARQILEVSGVQGGLVVHVGCGDGRLTAALRANEHYIVQGLARGEDVEQARAYLQSLGDYGPVSVEHWTEGRLPYADNLVNLLVASSEALEREEVLRVLVPGGVAIFLPSQGETGGFEKVVKSWPDTIDSWTHYLHGPDNNAVAQDSAVGPPQRMQWVNGPRYARSHEINSSMAAMVSGGGRLFFIWDDGPTGLVDNRFPSQWALIARDAFNGITLWKRPIPEWGWREWHDASRWDDVRERAKMLRYLPATLPRRLVASDGRLYVTLGYDAPVSELDGATGETLRTFEQTALADEILQVGSTLVLRVRVADSPPERDVWDVLAQQQYAKVMAVDIETGGTLWESTPEPMAPLTLAEDEGRVFYSSYNQVVCRSLSNGEEQWRNAAVSGKTGNRGTVGTLVPHGDVVLFAQVPVSSNGANGELYSFSAKTGELLWTGAKFNGPGISNPPDLFVVDGVAWVGETRVPIDVMEPSLLRQGFDPASGELRREISVPLLLSPGHHYRCYRSKATERFLLLPKRGVEFVDLEGEEHMRNDWLRAPCIYGMLPSNGLLYVAPHQCVCYPGVQLNCFNALAAGAEQPLVPLADSARLQHGPAWEEAAADIPVTEGDWPSYRHDPRRSGNALTAVRLPLEVKWRHPIGGNLSAPVVAGGRLLVADKDAHTIHALDAADGHALWQFTAGGRIDSPPTVHEAKVFFGSADGCVYCLRLDDGREVWRFMAAPQERRITAFGQVESAWPVHGSVVVQEDQSVSPRRAAVYCTAGRSSFLDGGIHVYGLDPDTGEILHRNVLTGPEPDPFTETGGAGYMDGSKSDLLVSDGADLYLFQERMRSDLKRVPAPMEGMEKENGGYRVYPASPERGSTGERLISSSGFLDDAFNEGTYWTFSRRWAGWDRKMRTVPSYGQLLSFDDNTVYGINVFTESIRVRMGISMADKGYALFARDHGAGEDRWSTRVPVLGRAMVSTADALFVAGAPDLVPEDDPLAAVEGRRGAMLLGLSASDGSRVATQSLDAPPVFDGMIAAHGRLFLAATDGAVVCFEGKEAR